jgi:hypothetical protein
MEARGPSVTPNMGAFAVISTAFDVAKSDLRIAGMQVLTGILGAIPFVGVLLSMITSGLAMQFADETLGNRAPDNSIAVRLAYTILTGIVMYIAILIGLILLVLPGIFLALKFALAIPAIWIGDQGPIEALSDSWERTGGNLLTIIGVGIIFFLIAMALFVPLFAVSLGGAALSAAAESGAGFLLASPILIVGTIVVAVTVGAVSVAAQSVMYRSFGAVGAGMQTETQF